MAYLAAGRVSGYLAFWFDSAVHGAADIPRPGFRDRAVRIAGHRSLSAEMIIAMSDAVAAASATRETAM